MTKCDEIFGLLVTDGQIVVPKGLKTLQLKQRKKKGFCKFHNFLGHKTSKCIIFRDLLQNPLKEGRLKFFNKPKPQEEGNLDSKMEEALFGKTVDLLMVDIVDNNKTQLVEISIGRVY